MIPRDEASSEAGTEVVGVRERRGEEEEEEEEVLLQQQLREEERLGTEEAPVEEATYKGGQQGGGSVWSSLVSGTLAILEPRRVETESGGGGGCWRTGRGGGGRWDLAVKRVVQCGPMRRLQERLLGHTWYTAANASGSVIWVLGVCYKITTDSSNESVSPALFQEFLNDFSSRLWFTYRRGCPWISFLLLLLLLLDRKSSGCV
jgi:hypothetical protein